MIIIRFPSQMTSNNPAMIVYITVSMGAHVGKVEHTMIESCSHDGIHSRYIPAGLVHPSRTGTSQQVHHSRYIPRRIVRRTKRLTQPQPYPHHALSNIRLRSCHTRFPLLEQYSGPCIEEQGQHRSWIHHEGLHKKNSFPLWAHVNAGKTILRTCR